MFQSYQMSTSALRSSLTGCNEAEDGPGEKEAVGGSPMSGLEDQDAVLLSPGIIAQLVELLPNASAVYWAPGSADIPLINDQTQP